MDEKTEVTESQGNTEKFLTLAKRVVAESSGMLPRNVNETMDFDSLDEIEFIMALEEIVNDEVSEIDAEKYFSEPIKNYPTTITLLASCLEKYFSAKDIEIDVILLRINRKL